MNKKELLKSINNVDDKFLREGEEFFAPEEGEKSLSVYRKKGISLKPVVSAAACCALVIAAAVFISSLGGNKPVSYSPYSAGTVDSENTETTEETEEGVDIDLATSDNNVSTYQKDINDEFEKAYEALQIDTSWKNGSIVSSCKFVHIAYGGVKEQADDELQRLVLNITEPTTVELTPVYSTHDGEPVNVRFYMMKDNEAAVFSALGSTDVTYVDTVFVPNSKIEVPISFTADQNDRIISVVAMFDFDPAKSDNDCMTINFLNASYNSELSEFVQENGGSDGECKIYQNDEGVIIEADFPTDWAAKASESSFAQMVGYKLYVNGKIPPASFLDNVHIQMTQPSGDNTMMNSDDNGKFIIQIPRDALDEGDVIQGAVIFRNDGKIAFSFKETVK